MGSATSVIVSELDRSRTKTKVLFPLTSVKYAASQLNFLIYSYFQKLGSLAILLPAIVEPLL
jgi:hypothetical protein